MAAVHARRATGGYHRIGALPPAHMLGAAHFVSAHRRGGSRGLPLRASSDLRRIVSDPQDLPDPVVLDEDLPLLAPRPGGVYLVDVRFVGGLESHSLDVRVCVAAEHAIEQVWQPVVGHRVIEEVFVRLTAILPLGGDLSLHVLDGLQNLPTLHAPPFSLGRCNDGRSPCIGILHRLGVVFVVLSLRSLVSFAGLSLDFGPCSLVRQVSLGLCFRSDFGVGYVVPVGLDGLLFLAGCPFQACLQCCLVLLLVNLHHRLRAFRIIWLRIRGTLVENTLALGPVSVRAACSPVAVTRGRLSVLSWGHRCPSRRCLHSISLDGRGQLRPSQVLEHHSQLYHVGVDKLEDVVPWGELSMCQCSPVGIWLNNPLPYLLFELPE